MVSIRCLCLLLAMCLHGSTALKSYKAEDGYEVFPTVPGSRYKLYNTNQNWIDALETCEKDGVGTRLVVINSQEEADVVVQLWARLSDTTATVSVGISDIAEEGTWLTLEGESVSESGYDRWRSGQPDDGFGDQDCGVIRRGGLYDDVNCGTGNPFICEKPNA